MNPEKLLRIIDAEEGSCVNCKSGVLMPNKEGEIIFAKCKEETRELIPFFNIEWYDGKYRGFPPQRGNILSKDDLPCKGKLFEAYTKS